MKGLSAGLTFFSCSVVSSVLLGLIAAGLGGTTAWLSLIIGGIAAIIAYFGTVDPGQSPAATRSRWRYQSILFWLMAGCFTLFAVRSFCWLLYIDGPEFRIQSVNNLGDLALHVTYIKTFANGVPLWPDNPIYPFSHLRYPAGVDLFNGLLTLVHVDLIHGLVWVGLAASLATFYAFYRWSGLFGVAAFLFNGGVVGFQFFNNFEFRDYQGQNTIAWKSIPLSMFVTQRGLLYAIPAGVLLLWHWRQKFYGNFVAAGADPGRVEPIEPNGPIAPPASQSVTETSSSQNRGRRGSLRPGPLPFWAELTLYCSMPLFHVHTFLALSAVAASLFLFGDARMRWHLAILVAAALIPATFFVWLITDHFHASSMLKWQPGWVQNIGDFAHPLGAANAPVGTGFLATLDQVLEFWLLNFGFLIPLIIYFLVILGARAWRERTSESATGAIRVGLVPLVLTIMIVALAAPFLKWWWYLLLIPVVAAPPTVLVFWKARNQRLGADMALIFTFAALLIFLFAYLFKTAPWEWDNLKLIFWSYFIVLPFLWRGLISQWVWPLRIVIYIALFGSGFVSLFGGLGLPGYGFANRAEIAAVGVAVRKLPLDARFATFPTFNHPILLQGRKVVLGYPGHLWTQGFDHYGEEEAKLGRVMRGEPDWRQQAKALGVRYIFWGREEQTNYPTSTHPWENVLTKVATGPWGTIYDLQGTIAGP